ncbi:secreted peptidase [Vibrio nigripulchritudo ATCC 27043]|uniref:S1 family peptidase n=1 Tax=Vibrio nigripulchritudo TaxID=28173 RepID=UPI00021C3F1F|nr:serine protease [Vibrio nigripulchritudo]EGU54777.1 secreted peptidase [Vibrio nigripulchritudo ATCC 27043]
MKSKLRLLSVLVAGTFGTAFVQAEENSVQPRIIGGAEVAHSSVPYQVALQTPSGFQFCGGTIIARDWVLTAAHCLDGKSASGVQIRIGVSDLRTNQGEKHNVSQFIVHEGWGTSGISNDIALLKLATPVDAKYKIAKLPTPEIKARLASLGSSVKVSGWGQTVTGDPSGGSDVLKATNLNIISNSECTQLINLPGISVPKDNICGYKARTSSCYGDSGGPFVKQSGSDYYLIGAVSWGQPGCAAATAFADVTQFVPWISQKSGVTPDGGGTTPPPTDGCSGVVAWELYKQYNQGDRAVANGTLFEANYRHYGVNPFSDYWGYWTMVQTCN